MATRRRTTIVIASLVVVLGAGAAVPTTIFLRRQADERRLQQAATAFAAAWKAGRLETVAYRGTAPAEVARRTAAIAAGLTSAASDLPAAVEVLGVDRSGQAATATERLRVRWTLGTGRTWTYETAAPLARTGDRWEVAWSPAVVHPRLTEGQVLSTARTAAERGRIIGARDEPLVTAQAVVVVGIQPGRATDRAATARQVAGIVDVDPAALTQRVQAASATAFVEVITLRRPDYDAVRAQLQPIPGTVFRESVLSLGRSAQFARALLGSAGPATADVVKASGGRVRAGDVTGLSGIQRRYDAQLSGVPGLMVRAVPATGTTPAPVQLWSAAPVNGKDLRLTLDARVQEAAERALTKATKPAALVAVRASTGEVLAVANGGPAASGYNRALIGRYPPGSTFKVATTYALLQVGVTPSTPIDCPPTITVDGRSFSNAEDEKLGSVPFGQDFAQSCNTAFIGAAKRVTAAQLAAAAQALGYGRPNQLGVDAFTGQVPATASAVEHAADAIGQGTVLASPLTVATVSASVAAGAYHPPRLVLGTTDSTTTDSATSSTGPASDTATVSPGGSTNSTDATTDPASGATTDPASGATTDPASGAAAPVPTGAPLAAGPIGDLRTLMAAVVTNGTGTALKSVPGGQVRGKTGTAEFGSENPPRTHAWFTGYQGDVAFAVVVEDGGFGGKVAAPLAAQFLTALA